MVEPRTRRGKSADNEPPAVVDPNAEAKAEAAPTTSGEGGLPKVVEEVESDLETDSTTSSTRGLESQFSKEYDFTSL